MKRPSFQFYPGDWLQDASLRMCSVAARGLWIDMICLMHQGSDYGYLKVNHKVIHKANLARMVGATLHEVEGWLSELSDAGVYSIDEDGCIFSRRMIRDEEVRQSRAAGGKLGGNPALKKVKGKDNLPPNLQPTPSSSSSSSSSDTSLPVGNEETRTKKRAPAVLVSLEDLIEQGVPEKHARDWLAVRKAKRAPLTRTAWEGVIAQAALAGLSIGDAVKTAAEKNWQGFEAAWVNKPQTTGPGLNGQPKPSIHEQRAAVIAGLTGRSHTQQPYQHGFIIDGGIAERLD